MPADSDKNGVEGRDPLGGPSVDRLGDALLNGSFAHTFTGSKPPTHFNANELWAWHLGWRLQEFLQQEGTGK